MCVASVISCCVLLSLLLQKVRKNLCSLYHNNHLSFGTEVIDHLYVFGVVVMANLSDVNGQDKVSRGKRESFWWLDVAKLQLFACPLCNVDPILHYYIQGVDGPKIYTDLI